MKILIMGSRGMLARVVTKELDGSCELYKRDTPELDICDKEMVLDDIRETKPDFVINCAAYTNVDGCEAEKESAFAVNADGAANIALACKESGSLLYHISTDFIFDGRKKSPYVETDEANPLSVYGRSKLEGERQVQSILTRYVIIRTAWLFGKGGNNFVSTIGKLSEEKDELKIVNDQFGCPTYALDLARAIKSLLSIPAQGIYHFCNAGICTWYAFGLKVVELMGQKTTVTPVTTREFVRPAVRPAYSVLDCGKFTAATGFRIRPWQDALKEYLS